AEEFCLLPPIPELKEIAGCNPLSQHAGIYTGAVHRGANQGSTTLFAQITRKGKNVDVHNHPTEATIGIISTDNKLPLPNIMLIARPVPVRNGQVPSGCRTEQLVLTRLLPLKFVRISVHDPDRQRIKLKLINGRSYYLQLYASPGEQELLFDRWLSLIYLLHHPPDCYLRPNSSSEEEEEGVVSPQWAQASPSAYANKISSNTTCLQCPSQHPQWPPMIIPSHTASPRSLSHFRLSLKSIML
uniref:Golgi associated RAB2 interactor protein-like Rab2B-binding domain-containing protein n=1 Tax=Chelydra serpentina TaxID=8475 RepID=A0A8C3S8D5_CHESE